MSIAKEIAVVHKLKKDGKTTVLSVTSYKLAEIDRAIENYKALVSELKFNHSVELITDFVL